MFKSNNCTSFHLWWKESLVKHWKISKYCETECRSLVPSGGYWNPLFWYAVACIFIAIVLQHGCSPANLLHIFRTPFYNNTSGRLHLNFWASASEIWKVFYISLLHLTHRNWNEINLLIIATHKDGRDCWVHV